MKGKTLKSSVDDTLTKIKINKKYKNRPKLTLM